MDNILLISENYLRTNFNISDNVQSKYLLSAIRQAQEINYQSVVGGAMLRKLTTLISEGKIKKAENDIYKQLVDASQMFLAYSAICELIVIVNIKIDNIGVNMTSDENVEVLGLDDMFRMQDYYRTKADYYLNVLQNWIVNNVNSLPEINSHNIHDIYSNIYSAASCGVNLGGARGKTSPLRNYKRELGYDKP